MVKICASGARLVRRASDFAVGRQVFAFFVVKIKTGQAFRTPCGGSDFAVGRQVFAEAIVGIEAKLAVGTGFNGTLDQAVVADKLAGL